MPSARIRRAVPIALSSILFVLLIAPPITNRILPDGTQSLLEAAQALSPGPIPERVSSTSTPTPHTRAMRQTATTFAAYFPFVVNGPVLDPRFAVAATTFMGKPGDVILSSLHVQRYYKYSWGEPIPGLDDTEMVARSNISDVGFDDFVRSHPGLYYMIGNEPNVPDQDNLPPDGYADTLHTWILRIKTLDSIARILNGAVANWPDNDAAIAYLSAIRQAYLAKYGQYPPIDVWSIHAYPPIYVTPDGRPHSYCDTTIPKAFVTEAVGYLRSVGETGPVWLTEFGMDWGDDSDPCFVTFMQDMVHWLKQARLVDRWYWYSTNSWAYYGQGGALIDLQGNLTTLGRTYRDLAAEYPLH